MRPCASLCVCCLYIDWGRIAAQRATRSKSQTSSACQRMCRWPTLKNSVELRLLNRPVVLILFHRVVLFHLADYTNTAMCRTRLKFPPVFISLWLVSYSGWHFQNCLRKFLFLFVFLFSLLVVLNVRSSTSGEKRRPSDFFSRILVNRIILLLLSSPMS